MASLHTATVTFTAGTAVNLATALGIPVCGRLLVQPGVGNSHVCYVGDASLATGTSTTDHVIYQIAKPSAVDAVQDKFEVDLASRNSNDVKLAQYSVDGTTSEKCRVSVWVD